jgi:Zn-finger nucleic acid-binding protein
MMCPRCESATLDERDRDGVTIDVCRTCRGIWLDRGELEKIMARATSEMDGAYERGRSYRDEDPPSSDKFRDGRRHHRKRGWLENLGDIFD